MPGGDTQSDSRDELHALRPLLKPAQERVLAALVARGEQDVTRATYQAIAHVSRSQAAYDLADLVKLGLVDRVGSGRATRYRVVREGEGRRRKWTAERIRDELERFCRGRDRWPGAAEFRDSGRGSLYLAASRYGGIEHWATELGFHEPEHDTAGPGVLALEPESPPGTALVAAAAFALALLGVVLIVQLAPGRPADVESERLAPRERLDAAPGAVPSRGALAGATGVGERVALRLAAAGAGSWVAARSGSAAGPLLWRGTLEPGESLRLQGKGLWLRVGTPSALVARVDGASAKLPPRPSTLRVTRGGIRVLATAPASPAPAPATTAPPPAAQPVATTSSVPATATVASPPPPSTPAPRQGGSPTP
ncbi:MAG TPA: hypothetical protein VFR63_11070, partial [Gaiellaceae bacterium]|nr:hypothetical protein [Gaiellaceae bacterium]